MFSTARFRILTKQDTLMKILLYTSLLVLLTSCSGPKLSLPVDPGQKQIVDIADLFQSGHSRFQSVMDDDSTLNKVWQNRREEVVLVFIDIQWDDGEKEQAQQSGIILNDGALILTAGHGFVIEDGEITQIRIRTISSQEAVANIVSLVYDKKRSSVVDWALLKPVHALHHSKSKPLSPDSANDAVLVLGYPGAMGVNKDGRVVRIQESLIGHKYPLGLVCEQELLDNNTLIPLAGTVPIRGISGAPVFNAGGELIGLFSSMGRRRNLIAWQYVFWMSEVPWERINAL